MIKMILRYISKKLLWKLLFIRSYQSRNSRNHARFLIFPTLWLVYLWIRNKLMKINQKGSSACCHLQYSLKSLTIQTRCFYLGQLCIRPNCKGSEVKKSEAHSISSIRMISVRFPDCENALSIAYTKPRAFCHSFFLHSNLINIWCTCAHSWGVRNLRQLP